MREKINFAVLGTMIISFIFTLKYSTLEVFCNLPGFLKSFFVYQNGKLNEYNLYYDIALGIFVSCVFYFLIEYLPNFIRMKNARAACKSDIEMLLGHLNMLISIILKEYEISKAVNKIRKLDVLKVTSKNLKVKPLYMEQYTLVRNKIMRDFIYESSVPFEYILKINRIYDIIDRVEMNTPFFGIDEELLNLLSRLKNNIFLERNRANHLEKDGQNCFLLINSDDFMELINTYREISKLKITNKTYSIKFHKNEVLKSSNTKGSNKNKIKNTMLLFDKNDYISQIIVGQMIKNGNLIKNNIKNEIDKKNVDKYSLVVLIVPQSIKRQVYYTRIANKIIAKNKSILLIKQSRFFRKVFLDIGQVSTINKLHLKTGYKKKNKKYPMSKDIEYIIHQLSKIQYDPE